MAEEILDRVFAAVDPTLAGDVLRRLIDVPSPTGEERPCAEEMVRIMAELGLVARLQEIDDQRANAVGALAGDGRRTRLMLNGHLDTSYNGREEDDYVALGPIRPGDRPRSYLKDGYIFGLGAHNMKGGLAAAVAALAALKRAGVQTRRDVMVSGVAGESEKSQVAALFRDYTGHRYRGAGFGARYLVTHGYLADYALECEPSDLYVVNARTGYLFVKLTVHGRFAYQATKGPAYPGVNAVMQARAVLDAIEAWEPEYAARHTFDAGLGLVRPNLNVGAIEAGWPFKPTYAPGVCCIYLDIRIAPGQDPASATDELQEVLRRAEAEHPGLRVSAEVYCSNVPGTATPVDAPIVQATLRGRELVVGSRQERFPTEEGSPWTDSNIFRQHGIPAAGCGPGERGETPEDIQRWQEGQHVSIADLVRAARIYAAVALELDAD